MECLLDNDTNVFQFGFVSIVTSKKGTNTH